MCPANVLFNGNICPDTCNNFAYDTERIELSPTLLLVTALQAKRNIHGKTNDRSTDSKPGIICEGNTPMFDCSNAMNILCW